MMMIMFPSIYVPHSPFSPSLPSLRMKFILIILNNAKNNTSFRFNLPHRFLLIRTVLFLTHMFSSPSSYHPDTTFKDCSLSGEREVCVEALFMYFFRAVYNAMEYWVLYWGIQPNMIITELSQENWKFLIKLIKVN